MGKAHEQPKWDIQREVTSAKPAVQQIASMIAAQVLHFRHLPDRAALLRRLEEPPASTDAEHPNQPELTQAIALVRTTLRSVNGRANSAMTEIVAASLDVSTAMAIITSIDSPETEQNIPQQDLNNTCMEHLLSCVATKGTWEQAKQALEKALKIRKGWDILPAIVEKIAKEAPLAGLQEVRPLLTASRLGRSRSHILEQFDSILIERILEIAKSCSDRDALTTLKIARDLRLSAAYRPLIERIAQTGSSEVVKETDRFLRTTEGLTSFSPILRVAQAAAAIKTRTTQILTPPPAAT